MSLAKVRDLTSFLTGRFLSGETDEIHLLFTQFVSTSRYRVTLQRFLNIEQAGDDTAGIGVDYIFEPDPAAIYDDLMPRFAMTKIQTALADSFASELGVSAKMTYLITKLSKRVRPGTEGGVSWRGQGAALLGAAIPSVLGWLLISDLPLSIPYIGEGLSGTFHEMQLTPFTLLIPLVVGFVGCQLDSILGATLQTRGRITNDEVNYISIYAGVVMAWVLGSLLT